MMSSRYYTRSSSAWEQLQTERETRISLGCPILDKALGGGIGLGITEICGEAGVGKTQFALQLSYTAQLKRGGCVAFISTEGQVPTSRLLQIVSSRNQDGKGQNGSERDSAFLSRIYIDVVHTLNDQWTVLFDHLEKLLRVRKDARLIVIDSIAACFRSTSQKGFNAIERSREMLSIGAQLKKLSLTYGIPVLVLNQVSDVFDSTSDRYQAPPHRYSAVTSKGRLVKPALGPSWSTCVNTRLFLSRQHGRRSTYTPTAPQQPDSPPCPSTAPDGVSFVDTVSRQMHVIWSPLAGYSVTPYIVETSGVSGLE
jgi:DNA-repair protein XRCC3